MRIVGADLRQGVVGNEFLDEFIRLDVCQSKCVTELIRDSRPDWVFHLAGLTSGREKDIYRTNLLGTVNLLDSLQQDAPNARILLVGSAAEYGRVDPAQLPIGTNDILALDSEGNLIIIEAKRDWSDRSTVGQILDYAAHLQEWDYAAFNSRSKKYFGQDVELIERFREFVDNSDFPKFLH